MLRKVEHGELVAGVADFEAGRGGSKRKTIAEGQLSDVFGIEIAEVVPAARVPTSKKAGQGKSGAVTAQGAGRVSGKR